MKRIRRDELQELVGQNWSTGHVATYYKVSARTISRALRRFGLKGVRPRGRKPRTRRHLRQETERQ